MRYVVDHDLHIHSYLSLCSSDPEQSNENILNYAKQNSYRTICLTNHFWDSQVPGANGWYAPQDYSRLKQALPLPQDKDVSFRFGCEAEMDSNMNIGLAKENFDLFEFIIVPTTHLHMRGLTITEKDFASEERRAELYIARLQSLLSGDYPFHKMGIAHLTCDLIAGAHHLNDSRVRILNMISDESFEDVFRKAASVGIGIEINVSDESYPGNDEALMRPFRIAKKCGCRFYFGSDSHHLKQFEGMKERCEKIVDMLELEETDKFSPF